eukprot:1187279-Pyramimonas_sp.AAC.1
MKHKHCALKRAKMSILEALRRLGELEDHEHFLTESMFVPTGQVKYSVLEHAMLTAEHIRLAYPEEKWFHVTGLVHSLGKLLSHKVLGEEPQWAVCGETFPVGCRFEDSIAHSEFFIANPDRRKRRFNTRHGVYSQNCGLAAVNMSWSAYEYLYHVLRLNKVPLPEEAYFTIRYQTFESLGKGGAYACL